MGREHVADEALAGSEVPFSRIHNTEMRGAAPD
jgi:hypothetical protein